MAAKTLDRFPIENVRLRRALGAIGGNLVPYTLATGNVDLGLFNIIAQQLVSTAITGTPPLVLVSETVVTHLNADFLDGQHGVYYEPAASVAADARAAISSSVTNLLYDNTTGIFTLTALYAIPLATDTAAGVTAHGWGNHAGLYLPIGGGTLTGTLTAQAINVGAYNLTVDTNVLYVDAVHNMVGINCVPDYARAIPIAFDVSSAEFVGFRVKGTTAARAGGMIFENSDGHYSFFYQYGPSFGTVGLRNWLGVSNYGVLGNGGVDGAGIAFGFGNFYPSMLLYSVITGDGHIGFADPWNVDAVERLKIFPGTGNVTTTGIVTAGSYKVGAAAGIDATVPVAPVLPATVAGSMTFVKGILTAYTAPS